MFFQTPLRNFFMVGYLLICIYIAMTADYFGVEILTELLILAMIALALGLVAGFGGMVSLCHGALAGLFHQGWQAWSKAGQDKRGLPKIFGECTRSDTGLDVVLDNRLGDVPDVHVGVK